MLPNESDLFPVYDSQDLSAFALLMLHRAISLLGLPHHESSFEDEMRNSLQEARPEVLNLLDRVMDAYQDWVDAIIQKTDAVVRDELQAKIENLRSELSPAVSR